MGYACPVCGDPQADARHLANHLAFTALLGHEDHEAWLAEHAPGWADEGERELADRVADLAEEAEYPQVFEDTTGRMDAESRADDRERSGALFDDEGHGHEHAHGAHTHRAHGPSHSQGLSQSHGTEVAEVPRDPQTAEILEEARALTREMREPNEDDAGTDRDGDDRTDDGGGTTDHGDGTTEDGVDTTHDTTDGEQEG